MKKLFILFLISSFSFAQNADRKYEKNNLKDGVLTITTSDGDYLIKILTENIAETSFIPKGETYNPISHAVILQPKAENLIVLEKSKSITYSSNGIIIAIQKSPFQISYSYKNKAVISERLGYVKKDSTQVIEFNLDPKENLYGGGARVLGMNRRGNRLQLYNRAQYGYETRAELMNYTIPLVLSSNKYAIHFDNPAIGYLDLDSKKDNTLAYETISGRKTYQVIVGDSWENITENYTRLTGRQPLPPRWAFGNFSSRFGYHSQEEVIKTINKFKEEKIPVDAIILDLYWFGKTVQGTMGNLDWDKENFPDPEKMISDLNQKGVKTILITEPFVLTTSSKWQEVVDKKIVATDKNGDPFKYDFYFGNTGIIDIFKPQGKDWFWNIYKNLINQGVSGLWGDLGEPEVFPSKAITAAGNADDVHNIYGHNWAKLIDEGYKKEFPTQRPFILMRSGYSGSQRFGMIPWSGDVSRSWGGLSGQTEIALQMGMQGLAYMHSDLGGFAGANLDDELYTRWLQYGVFQPIFRPHAQEDVPSEPVFRAEKTKQLAKQAIELRYQLLPYNYTLGFENNQTGKPLMRPLFFEEPENEKLLAKADEYLWGNNFLVAPIINQGQKEKEVYFPNRSNWFDFYTDQKYEGGTTQIIKTDENHIPTFVRGGCFIPMIKTIQSTQEYETTALDLHYYFDKNTQNALDKVYDDNGKTPNAFEKGEYEILSFSSVANEKKISIKLNSEIGKSYQYKDRNISLIIHNINVKVKKVTLDGKTISVKKIKNTLSIPVFWEKSQTKQIIIKL
jgi:oligosaccharide 4-alpha-D-glucosyltransferase